jgi:hypothetical protein
MHAMRRRRGIEVRRQSCYLREDGRRERVWRDSARCANLAWRPGKPARDRAAVPGLVGSVAVFEWFLAPSSSGPGRRPLKAVARVQIPLGLHRLLQVRGLAAGYGGQALIIRHWLVIGFWHQGAADGPRKCVGSALRRAEFRVGVNTGSSTGPRAARLTSAVLPVSPASLDASCRRGSIGEFAARLGRPGTGSRCGSSPARARPLRTRRRRRRRHRPAAVP